MDISEKVKIVTHLQKVSKEVFEAVSNSLEVGMSEVDIAELAKVDFEKRGITEFWYDVPLNVLVGIERFRIGTTTADYSIKAPAKDVFLDVGSTVFIDLSPMDPDTKTWGDFASMIVFRPRGGTDEKQLEFLSEVRNIQLSGVSKITAETTGAEVANYYIEEFKKRGITLLDVRNNVGHSIHAGSKEKTERVWLDLENTKPFGEGIFTIEPGGARGNLVARFEECIYIPKEGSAKIL